MQVAVAMEDIDAAIAVLEAAERDLPASVLSSLRHSLTLERSELKDFPAGAGAGPSTEWLRLAQTLPVSQRAFREVLAVLGGALIRRNEYDGRLCDAADALVEEILRRVNSHAANPVHWDGMSLLDAATSFTHVGRTVRLRFPGLSVWALPNVGHEVGHLLVSSASAWDDVSNQPQLPLLALTREDGQAKPDARRGELAADILATLALGPAYACSALLLEFNPAQAHLPVRAHPPATHRVHVILGALDALGVEYRWTREKLSSLWLEMLDAADCPALEEDIREALDGLVQATREAVQRNVPELPYDGLTRAAALEEHLRRGEGSSSTKAAPEIADVLVAAWRVRLGAEISSTAIDLKRVSERAADLCLSAAPGG